ncbi:MAG TPA: class E sortase [Candidatus Saccharimonadales bacterium]|nr:class E sortase [Candidatus Saccharimonadales bacterium]
MNLARINTVLFAAIAAVCLYIVVAPIAPAITFWAATHTGNSLQKLSDSLRLPATDLRLSPHDNRLIIPAMLLNTPINEGADLASLRTGPWRRPNGSTPAHGGNTVIAAHRFTYTNPRGAFYYLNKLQPGDLIGVFWEGKRYMYKVASTQTVPPTDIAIEAPTPDARLTLYTCTPLWLPKDRLVVVAELESAS